MNENRATYSPEDNKLRLYIGRVPREEYLKLKAEGWVTLHKQRDAGGGDFAATWTPTRRDTALEYAGIIEDEDMGPDERAADRAERFSGYRDKRTGEAVERADSYDSGPSAHGYQSEKRAERAAARHDRIGARAVDAWSKAEYWQRRTAGVINHALYVSSPGVRMGRIKTIEAELRKLRASLEEYRTKWNAWKKCEAVQDPEAQTAMAKRLAGSMHIWSEYPHPTIQTENKYSLYRLLDEVPYRGIENWQPITGAQACALYFSDHSEPQTETDWTRHLELRLAYENQMIEAQGGRAAFVEMEVGGWIGKHQIRKVNKSSATGRVVSVNIAFPSNGKDRWGNERADAPKFLIETVNIERLSVDAYRPPTEEEKAAFAEKRKTEKAEAPKKAEPPLINPTDADAERLLAIWNAKRRAKHDEQNIYKSESARASHDSQFKPATIERVTQAVYSANSKGSYAKAETRGLCANGELEPRASNMWTSEGERRAKERGPVVCKIRVAGYDPYRILILTDKPQKPLPAQVWEKLPAQPELIEA